MDKLTKIKGALPYLIAVFLNAFVDLGHKIVVQNSIFKIYDGSQQVILTAVVNGLILLPFLLLFSPAGFLSDKYPKHKVMHMSAWVAVVLTLAITFCYYQGWFWVAFAMTFLLAVQSALYSPAKLGYIKAMFGKEGLARGNAAVQAVGIIAILCGIIAFTVLFEMRFPENSKDHSEIITAIAPLGWLLVIGSVIELIMVYRLPAFEKTDKNLHFDMKAYLTGSLVKENLLPLRKRKVIFLSIVGLAMFWSVGQVLLAAFPAYAKETLNITNTITIQGLLASTGIGIALGAWIAGRFSKNHIETGLVPVGAAGLAAALWVVPYLDSVTGHAINFLVIGTMGGLFIVPLNALIQFHSGDKELGLIIAANNWVQNTCMLFFLILTAVVAVIGASSEVLLYMIACLALIGGIYTVIKLPQSLTQFVILFFVTRRYSVSVQGMKEIPAQGGVLLLGNHVSWLDWAILQLACPRPVRFVMERSIYELWYIGWLFKLFGAVPIESGIGSKRALHTMSELLNQGEVVCVFPEGAISRSGHLGEFRKGFERACDMANDDVVIQPFYLRGLWGSKFSRASSKLKSRSGLRRNLIVAFGKPIIKTSPAAEVKQQVFELSISSWQQHVQDLPTIANAFIDACKHQGSKTAVIDPISGKLSASKLLSASIALSKLIHRNSKEQNVGILLPTSNGGVITNMASLLAGKTLVNLNYTASSQALLSALEQAEINTIYSSRRFIKKLEARGFEVAPILEKVQILYLEELFTEISKQSHLSYLVQVKVLPAWLLKLLYCTKTHNTDTAAILFSSGSEGAPKGIMLSHQNIIANLQQINDVLNTQEDDVMLASLPLFHAFGLTVTQFLPLIEGLPMICHPDPTDALGAAKAIAKHKATLLFGTSTFFRLYCRNKKIHPLMLESLRFTVAGAEKLSAKVRDDFKLKFNKDILEGYGVTETTPVASCNLPDMLDTNYWLVQKGGQQGTVGMPLPGASFRVVDPETFENLATGEAGMILIGGAQVMKGYLNDEQKTASVIKMIDGRRWYITGDKGHLDESGYLTIVDRYSRFAKLGGEMISLSSVEQAIQTSLQLEDAVAVNLPDDKKGEKIIILCLEEVDPKNAREQLLASGCNPLMLPSQFITVAELPKLGSGKTDFSLAKHLALEAITQ